MKQALPKEARLLFFLYALKSFLISVASLASLYIFFHYFITDWLNLPNGFDKALGIFCLILAFLSALPLILKPTLGYKCYQYEITATSVYLKEGYLTKVESYFPMKRLQKVKTYSGPFMRLLGLKGVILLSAGSTLSIDALKAEVADSLSETLMLQINQILEEAKNDTREGSI